MGTGYKVSVSEGISGDWQVAKIVVSKKNAEIEAIRAPFSGGRYTPEGNYTRLTYRGSVIMSDTPDEYHDHREPICRARGLVLIHGLGLGMVLQAIARKTEVEHVLVIEQSIDVLNLVADHYLRMFPGKVDILQGDAYTWPVPKRSYWDVIWHDIWPSLSLDNLPEMTRLHRRFGRRCNWQGSWGKDLLEYRLRCEKRQSSR